MLHFEVLISVHISLKKIILIIALYMCVGSVVPDPLQPQGLYSPPGSSVHEIFQARILEWVAISYSRSSS